MVFLGLPAAHPIMGLDDVLVAHFGWEASFSIPGKDVPSGCAGSSCSAVGYRSLCVVCWDQNFDPMTSR